MGNIVDTVEDRIQNAILTAIDNIVTPKIELAIRSINASSGRDVASTSGNSERREHEEINASFENASENNRTLGITNTNDETRRDSHGGVSELPVLGTQFDRQSPTHHMPSGVSSEIHHRTFFIHYGCQLRSRSYRSLFTFTNVKIFLETIANLFQNATKMVRISQNVQILGFSGKKKRFRK